MSNAFENTVCRSLRTWFHQAGFESDGSCLFKREGISVARATALLVEGSSSLEGQFMVRLAISLPSVDPDVAVLATDLSSLLAKGAWYPWRDAPSNEFQTVKDDLRRVGLPWLDTHVRLEGLADALEKDLVVRQKPPTHRWWYLASAARTQEPLKERPNNLRYLSYCYEALGRTQEAVEMWRRYAATHTLLDPTSEASRNLERRLAALKAALRSKD